MSRIGKRPISIPAGVEVKISKDNLVSVKGPKGQLQGQISNTVKIENKDNVITLTRIGDNKTSRSLYGLSRTLIDNMVTGVTNGYEKTLKIIGVGYKAEKKGNVLVLNLGYSHPVELTDPEGLEVELKGPNELVVKGISKELVGNYAAIIKSKRPTEPYKGKGIRYDGEKVIRKEGKAGVSKGE